MAISIFDVQAGISIDNTAHMLVGVAAPGGTTATDDAPQGSSYSRADGTEWKKVTAGTGTGAWLALVTTADLGGASNSLARDPVVAVTRIPGDVAGFIASGTGVGKTFTAGVAGTTTWDSILLADGDRALVKDAASAIDNGVYVVSNAAIGLATVLTRATDVDADTDMVFGLTVYVEGGLTNGARNFRMVQDGAVAIDVNGNTWDTSGATNSLANTLNLTVAALQGEVDLTQTSMGTIIDGTGAYVDLAAPNFLSGAADVTGLFTLVDTEVGADLTPVSRTNSPVSPTDPLNAKISDLDTAIGADADLSPLTRSLGQLALGDTLMANLDALDTVIGVDVTPASRTTGSTSTGAAVNANIDALDDAIGDDTVPVLRTNSPLLAGNGINTNLEALDVAIGTDAALSPLVRTAGPVTQANSVNANIDALDTALGVDVTAVVRTNNPLLPANDVSTNLEALDGAIGVTVTPVARTDNNPMVAANSVTSNLDALDASIGPDTDMSSTNNILTTNTVYANLSSLDAAIQASVAGLTGKDPVRVATTGTLTATAGNGTWVAGGGPGVGKTLTAGVVGLTVLDGVTLAENDRALIKDEANADNGIYVATSTGVGDATILTRAVDLDESTDMVANVFAFVSEGTVQADRGYLITTNDPITIDVTTNLWVQFTAAGGLGALQAEVDNIESALGSLVTTNGVFVALTGTQHLNGGTSVEDIFQLVDAEIGADVAAVVRVASPIVNGDPVNSNIDALDEAIGVTPTPGGRTNNPLVTTNAVNLNLNALDSAIGGDVTPNGRTTDLTATTNAVNANIDALDDAIGVDVTPVSRTASPIVVGPANANIDLLDTAIGTDFQLTSETTNRVTATNSVAQNLQALDQVAIVQVETTVAASTITTVDEINANDYRMVEWMVSVRDTTSPENIETARISAFHDGDTGAAATIGQGVVFAKSSIGTSPNATYTIDVNGTNPNQLLRLRVTTAAGTEVTVNRSAQFNSSP